MNRKSASLQVQKKVVNRCDEFKWQHDLINIEIRSNPLTEIDNYRSMLKAHNIGARKTAA